MVYRQLGFPTALHFYRWVWVQVSQCMILSPRRVTLGEGWGGTPIDGGRWTATEGGGRTPMEGGGGGAPREGKEGTPMEGEGSGRGLDTQRVRGTQRGRRDTQRERRGGAPRERDKEEERYHGIPKHPVSCSQKLPETTSTPSTRRFVESITPNIHFH